MDKPSYVNFNHSTYEWKGDIDYRQQPHLYKIGKGQQGVLTCEPYKSEILPYWRFKTPEIAKASADAILQLFNGYVEDGDFVGADMAKKFLHMGYTRSRRYANHKTGRKWQESSDGWKILPQDHDPVKAASAEIFLDAWTTAREDEVYLRMRAEVTAKYA